MDPWRVYQHWNPGKLIFGPNSLNELTKELSPEEVPLIITDKGVLNVGILQKIIQEKGTVLIILDLTKGKQNSTVPFF